MIRKIIDIDKLKHYPQNSYALLWVVMCFAIVSVYLSSAVLVAKFTGDDIHAATPSCSIASVSVFAGSQVTVSHYGFAAGESIKLINVSTQYQQEVGKTNDSRKLTVTQSLSLPTSIPAGQYKAMIVTRYPVRDFPCTGGPITIKQPVIPTACTADVNKDGKVNSIDQLLITKNFGPVIGTSIYDLNGDGFVNQADIDVAAKFFNQKCVVAASPTPTPSPSLGYLCTFSPNFISQGGQITVKSNGGTGPLILQAVTVSLVDISLNVILPLNGSVSAIVPASTTPGLYNVSIAGANNSYITCFVSPSTITTALLTVTTPTPSSSPTPAYILYISNSTIANKGFCQNGVPYINLSWYANVDKQFNIVKDGKAITSTTSSTWTSTPEVAGQTHTWRVDGITSGVTSDTLTITTPACTGV